VDVTANGNPPRPMTVRNMSPKNVTICCGDVPVLLPPLGECAIEDQSVRARLEQLWPQASPYLERDQESADKDEAKAVVVGVTFWIALIGSFVVASMTDGLLPVVGYLAVCVVGAVVVSHVVAKSHSSGLAARWVREKVALVLVLTLGFGIPATVLLFATQLFDQLRRSPGDALDAPLNRVVTFRLVQVVFLGIATTFPALLYFLFDRQNTATLRTRFLLAVFRLDRRIETARDWQAKYGRQADEAFGCHGEARLLRAHQAPVVVVTIVLALGWVLSFLNLDAVSVDGRGEMLAGGSLLQLFEPERGMVAFGFLGAYFFGVNTILRSYLRGDLRPKAYSQITARILIVVVLSSLVAITTFGDNTAVLAVAFFAGIVPDTVLQGIWEITRKHIPSVHFDEEHPLTELEGIDLYDRTRLEQEGVTNVESLAHCDLVDLLLQTRIPPGRLVDWVDQAILYLHVGGDDATWRRLRAMGVRTATDLLANAKPHSTSVLKGLGVACNEVAGARLTVLLAAIADDEWVEQLQHWRANEAPESLTIPHPAASQAESTTVVQTPNGPTPAVAEESGAQQAG
jgi:hypothetical protein